MNSTETTSELTLANADLHELYERSVQNTEMDIDLNTRVYEENRNNTPMVLREDFCGTAKLCADWVTTHSGRTAHGIDLHEPTLDYGRKKHLAPIGSAADRVSLHQQDVRDAISTQSDITVAFNFSYWIFQDLPELVSYFRSIREGLAKDGLLVLDIYGGPDAQIETEEEVDHGDFTYVWEQGPMDAITARAERYIHFRFNDGTVLEKAFVYDWRVWSLPEVRDALKSAGFSSVDVYWEGITVDGEGDGNFKKTSDADNEEAWIAYISAWA